MTLVDLFHILWTLAVALVLFSITVFVHELGHFLAARRFGLHVERFAIGMGPRLFGFKWRGVDYVFNWLPIGGYVALPQMAPMEAVEGKSDPALKALPPVSPWAKIVTAFFGPLFSLLLACLLAVGVWHFGRPDRPTLQTTTIGYVRPDSPAAQAGLQPGDKILAIDGTPVTRWMGGNQGVLESIIFSRDATIRLDILRAGYGQLTFDITPIRAKEMEGLRQIGIGPMEPLIADEILPHSPAARAGLQPGDVIVGVNGHTVFSTEQVSDLVRASPGPVQLTIRRSNELLHITLQPVTPAGSDRPMIGVRWRPPEPVIIHPLPWIQIKDAALLIKRTLGAVFDTRSEVGLQHLSGPVGIFDKIMALLRHDPMQVMYFFVILNVNLAILNLLPIPILDGGHIIFGFAEMIKRGPLPHRLIQALHLACFAFLIGLFLFITFHDVRRKASDFTQDNSPPPSIQFTEPATP